MTARPRPIVSNPGLSARKPKAAVPGEGPPAETSLAGVMMQNAVTDRRFDRAAQTLSLLANGRRLEILVMLLDHDRSVGELVLGSGSSFSAISQQLKLLTLGGLIEKQRQGRNIYYRLRDENAGAILRLVNEVMAEQAQ